MNDPAAPPRRWPLVPTLIVAAAILAMIALGVWQLQRKGEKEALIALYERHRTMSATVAYPALPPVPDAMLFRQSSVTCLEPVRWDPRSGTDRSGKSGIRMVADCRTGAEGPGCWSISASPRISRRPNGTAGRSRGRDRKSVVEGKSVSVRVEPGGRRRLKKKKK